MAGKKPNDLRILKHPVPWRVPKPERDVQGRVRTKEAAVALSAHRGPMPTRLATIGIRVNACEGFSPYNRQRRKWAKLRMSELAAMYGRDLSRGVGARVRSAAWAYAFAEWLSAKAAEAGDAGLATLAVKLHGRASGEDKKAQELAALEGQIHSQSETDSLDLGSILAEDT